MGNLIGLDERTNRDRCIEHKLLAINNNTEIIQLLNQHKISFRNIESSDNIEFYRPKGLSGENVNACLMDWDDDLTSPGNYITCPFSVVTILPLNYKFEAHDTDHRVYYLVGPNNEKLLMTRAKISGFENDAWTLIYEN